MNTPTKAPKKAPIPPDYPRGVKLLHDPARNKGTAFTLAERDLLGLRGLLPPYPMTQDLQIRRVMENFRRESTDLGRFIYLVSLQDRNETLFYRVVMDNLQEIMPIIYTPVVGKACQAYGHIYRRPRGLYISVQDRDRMDEVLVNWPHRDVRIIVVTDGERILGLGDLGTFGMGIPVGKLSLYTACGGIEPTSSLPICLDVGTNNETLLADPLYTGARQRRLQGAEYDAFIDEFVDAVLRRFPNVVLQLEDFATHNAFRLLKTYKDRICTFDDDIQGTGAVALAGVLSALRITKKKLTDCRFVFLGAGQAGTGIGNALVAGMVDRGLSREEARKHCIFLDVDGLVYAGRTHLADHNKPYAHDVAYVPDLLTAIKTFKPDGIIGASTATRAFSRAVIEAMAAQQERPIIFSLSNPTSKSECTAKQAYEWSHGRAIFASGSPFDPVDLDGKTFVSGQCNNAYIFPGMGLGAIASASMRVTDEMFHASADALAGQVTEADLKIGRVLPSLTRIREVSLAIAMTVARIAYERNLARTPKPDDLVEHIRGMMFQPTYPIYA